MKLNEIIREVHDVDLEELVSEECSDFGLVTHVQLRRLSDTYSCYLAIVEMSTKSQATEVADELGGTAFGRLVVLKLTEEAQATEYRRPPHTLH